MREYQQIWEALKGKPCGEKVQLRCSAQKVATIKKAVTKEKNMDEAHKVYHRWRLHSAQTAIGIEFWTTDHTPLSLIMLREDLAKKKQR